MVEHALVACVERWHGAGGLYRIQSFRRSASMRSPDLWTYEEHMSRAARVAYLQKAPSGHMNACLRALAEAGADLVATLPPPMADSPHDPKLSGWLPHTLPIEDWSDANSLMIELESFQPDVILVVSWDIAMYRKCARAFRGRAVRVLCMDNQWLGTAKQYVGVASAPVYLRPCFDRAFLPGDRQRRFARRLGFRPDEIDAGFYAADVQLFGDVASLDPPITEPAFAFLGRLVEEKGVDILARSYARYRRTVENPWPLRVAGTGPLFGAFDGLDGIEPLGFLDPPGVKQLLAVSTALVLPSRFEPWGVVVHEATSAGRLVLTTESCGAADDLVRHRQNGYVTTAVSEDQLLEGLLWVHRLTDTDIAEASATSKRLAEIFSPQRWASTVLAMCEPRP